MMPPPPPSPEADPAFEAVIRAAQRGDARALNLVLDRVIPIVERVCGGIARDAGQDAAQESLIAIMRSLPTLREPGAWRGWVVRIATREAIRQARLASPQPGIDPAAAMATPLDPAVVLDVAATIDRLPPEHRAMVLLRDVLGYHEAEVAAMLEVPVGTAKSRLARARKRFRTEWEGTSS